MQTGDMRDILRIQQRSAGKNKAGQRVDAWEDIPDREVMWGAPVPEKGAEGVAADSKTAQRRMSWKTHYRSDLNETMTIMVNGRRWDIKNIRELVPRRGLMIDAVWTQGQYKN